MSSSGTPAFLQRGCVAALDHGDEFLAAQVAKARANRDLSTIATAPVVTSSTPEKGDDEPEKPKKGGWWQRRGFF